MPSFHREENNMKVYAKFEKHGKEVIHWTDTLHLPYLTGYETHFLEDYMGWKLVSYDTIKGDEKVETTFLDGIDAEHTTRITDPRFKEYMEQRKRGDKTAKVKKGNNVSREELDKMEFKEYSNTGEYNELSFAYYDGLNWYDASGQQLKDPDEYDEGIEGHTPLGDEG